MKKNGFTLVELLAVIAILAILVAIVMPNVMKEYNKAKASVFVTDSKSFMNAAMSEFTTDAMNHAGKTIYYSSKPNSDLNTSKLNIDSDKEYFIEMDRHGNFKRFVIYNESYCYDIFTTYGDASIGILDGTKSKNNNGQPINKESISENDVWDSGNDSIDITVTKNGDIIESYFVKGCEASKHSFDNDIVAEGNALTLYGVLQKEAEEGIYAKKYTGEHKDSYTRSASHDIYHFHADDETEADVILNKNNVLFANHCWQMIRTTDVGGVKLLYNGEVDSNGKCGTDRGSHVGYSENFYYDQYSLRQRTVYASSYKYDSTTNLFSLDGEFSETSNGFIVGTYTCMSSVRDDTCSTLYFITARNKVYKITNGSNFSIIGKAKYDDLPNNYTAYYRTEPGFSRAGYMHGSDSYLLERESTTNRSIYYSDDLSGRIMIGTGASTSGIYGTRVVTYQELKNNYSSYSSYKYSCLTTSSYCNPVYIINIGSVSISASLSYYHGKDVEYVDGKYILKDVKRFNSSPSADEFKDYPYFCENHSSSCEEVMYLVHGYYLRSYTNFFIDDYLKLTNGKYLSDVKDDIFGQNNIDSEIKIMVDNWYKKHLLNYSNYFDDTIYCKDSTMSDGGFLGNTSSVIKYKNEGIKCVNDYDMYSISNDKAKLSYSISLPTMQELSLLGNSNVYKSPTSYWVNNYGDTDDYLYKDGRYTSGLIAYNMVVGTSGNFVKQKVAASSGIRPMISLKAGTSFVSGDGSVDTPYIVN